LGTVVLFKDHFLGWRMVLVAFFVDFVAVGFFFYSYGVFFKAIALEFGDSRLGVALGLTVTSAVGAIAAPLVGRALDRYPLKNVIGFGASSMGNLATSKLVANWFDRRRGTALGIAATGVSMSGVIMPYISAEIIEAYGWRQGFLLYGFFTLFVMVPVALKFIISRPEDVGLRPDGALQLPASKSDVELKPPPIYA
jgi:MFS family permease